MRRLRRYRIADTPSGLPFGRQALPRPAIVAVVAMVVAGALIGAFVGTETRGGSSTSGGSTSSTAELQREIGGVLRPLASARAAGWARQAGASGATQQAAAIATIAGAYGTAARQVATIPGSPTALRTVLGELAASYGSLAAAARAGDAAAYKRVASRVDAEEQRLSALAASLSGSADRDGARAGAAVVMSAVMGRSRGGRSATLG